MQFGASCAHTRYAKQCDAPLRSDAFCKALPGIICDAVDSAERESRAEGEVFVVESSQSSEQESDHALVRGHDDEKLSNTFHAGVALLQWARTMRVRKTDETSFFVEPDDPEPAMEVKITSSTAQTEDQARDGIEDQGPAANEHVVC
ncbi:hypothetical protein GN244_ATG05972 [Phytophthora infestans]|uniref:Uncharacterized protein n=1 Tax=Phytophthora infestans TaxID=4787 RepID=A0A833S6M8_PHYIN|nr:hypothetical protein GN244_ATG05972 [Phytophthora infestans]